MTEFHIVIPSARGSNLKGCLQSILTNEPGFPLKRIIVVDDGASAECEGLFDGITWIPGIKPFIFARNVNLGIRAAGTDVLILNDDARLKTPGGFTLLSEFMSGHPEVGICSSAIDGYVGNPNQEAAKAGFRTEGRVVAFISIYLPRTVYEIVGPLDERFTAYGGDDMDYSNRILKTGLLLGIHGGCVVTHDEELSTYRSKPEKFGLFQEGLRIYEEKWRS